MMTYADHVSNKRTPQSRPIPGEKQVKNTAGGFVYEVTPWQQFQRFLILGAEGGTYYIGERELTIENAKAAEACIAEDGMRSIQLIVDVSEGGRAPKNEPALFALALATRAADKEVRKAAWQALPKVARIGTHLFTFVEYRDKLAGWGRLARAGIANWYLDKGPDALAYQVLKYQNRNGWSHRDVLRLCHVHGDQAHNDIFSAITHPDKGEWEGLPALFAGVALAKLAGSAKDVANLVHEYRLSREMLPTEHLNNPVVLEALFQNMPMGAMVRNLGNLSKAGVLKPLSDVETQVVTKLTDRVAINKARLHPLALLVAGKIYGSGQGFRGKGSWDASTRVVSALDKAVELSFDAVEPTGRKIYLGVDVSGSMAHKIAGSEHVSCAEAAAVMALVTAKSEPNHYIRGFSSASGRNYGMDTQMRDLGITERDSFANVMRRTRDLTFGRTDCAMPMLDAMSQKLDVDVFIVLTDNETWHGNIHPSQALREYRNKFNKDAKLIVVAMAGNRFSIADPNDPGMLDVVGMDTAVPSVIAEFCRG